MADDTFAFAMSDPDFARNIMQDPIAAHLNLALHGLPSSIARYCMDQSTRKIERLDPPGPTFSLALHTTLAKTIHYHDDKNIMAIIRACMQVIITYSLIHEQFGWVGGQAHRAIENLTAKIGILVHFGTRVLPEASSSEASMKRNAVDAVMVFKNKGTVYQHFSAIIGKFVELDRMLHLDDLKHVMFRPEAPGAMRKVRVLSRLLRRGRDEMAG
ncbi:MAG: hypothetical protein Q9169_001220, partial [Polycauliona sp. 2 TL-2023]